ncbi:hypothetical protein SBRCBS47491_000938 [Sporothrix bragantina]|uniref:Prokaryotic-type class I peptide chain release factors domain-containing protein n=1 Tax=Sporothrix bragantina TaxID=671064 RepID=A0ABP0AUG1_9PEZI
MSRIFPFSALPACRRCLLGMASRSTHQSTSTTSLPAPPVRLFSVSLAHQKKQMPSRPQPPPDSEIDEMFVKGTGPGGQKINKTNSAVQLRHRPTGIVVKSQATRSRSQNRAIARGLLAARLDELWNGPASRTAVVAVAKQKKKANSTKKARRKYRKLEEEKEKEKEKEKLAREGVLDE